MTVHALAGSSHYPPSCCQPRRGHLASFSILVLVVENKLSDGSVWRISAGLFTLWVYLEGRQTRTRTVGTSGGSEAGLG